MCEDVKCARLSAKLHAFCSENAHLVLDSENLQVHCTLNGKFYDGRNILHLERFVCGKAYQRMLKVRHDAVSNIPCHDVLGPAVQIGVPKNIAGRVSAVATALAWQEHLSSALGVSCHSLGEAIALAAGRLDCSSLEAVRSVATLANVNKHTGFGPSPGKVVSCDSCELVDRPLPDGATILEASTVESRVLVQQLENLHGIVQESLVRLQSSYAGFNLYTPSFTLVLDSESDIDGEEARPSKDPADEVDEDDLAISAVANVGRVSAQRQPDAFIEGVAADSVIPELVCPFCDEDLIASTCYLKDFFCKWDCRSIIPLGSVFLDCVPCGHVECHGCALAEVERSAS
eukprot:gnl/MRDRNA2_/MRDRNA2_37049_c0_seq1.p1 gnl/MRDRNA2_/MRDRNA2_37049_c0~~gnl/MRDRNA2_/MRDRNA2_37049_c0_seq1.p1  ORF type:complete len:360 (+),score=59.40 gnl/MRDRNA2_/MRDRNA2_37049_c0_seq1:46-1080(+)